MAPTIKHIITTTSGVTLFLIASARFLIGQGVQLGYEWRSYNPSIERIPEDAIIGGYDVNGSNIFISQMRVEAEKIPSQLIPDESSSFAVYKGDIYRSAITAVSIPILCGTNFAWVYASMGNFPKNAIPCGKTENGDPMYVGRAEYNGSLIIGAVGPTRSALFAAFNKTEVQWFGMYKVLVYIDIDNWQRATFEDFPEDAVFGGYDKGKHNVYVGIIRVGNQVVPAQINPHQMLATASHPGGIEESDNFEVLTGGNYQWVSVKKGKMPENVVIAGRTEEGEAMHVGRVLYKRIMLSGSVLASENVLYISYLGKLRSIETGYEVLVRANGRK